MKYKNTLKTLQQPLKLIITAYNNTLVEHKMLSLIKTM